MDFSVSENETVLTIAFDGDIDMDTIGMIRERLFRTVRHATGDIVLDCSKVSYIDSTGLGVILHLAKLHAGKGKRIRFTNLSERVERIIELSSLMEVIKPLISP